MLTQASADIHEASTESDIRKCFPVVQELRPHLDENTYVDQVCRQRQQGYHLMYLQEDHQAVCMLGYRIQEYLAWGKILYIDDLGTLSGARKKGYAGKMLDWAIACAKSEHCHQVHLDSGYARKDAHRLYLNQGFILTSHHFTLYLQ